MAQRGPLSHPGPGHWTPPLYNNDLPHPNSCLCESASRHPRCPSSTAQRHLARLPNPHPRYPPRRRAALCAYRIPHARADRVPGSERGKIYLKLTTQCYTHRRMIYHLCSLNQHHSLPSISDWIAFCWKATSNRLVHLGASKQTIYWTADVSSA